MSIFLARNFGLCWNLEGGLWAEITGERLFCLGAVNTFLSFLPVVGSCWLPHLMDQYPHLMTATLRSKLQYTQHRQRTTKIANIFLASEPNWASSSPDNIYSCSVPGINHIYIWFQVYLSSWNATGGGVFQKLDFLNLNTISSFDKRVSPNGRLRFACALDWLATEAMKKQNNH